MDQMIERVVAKVGGMRTVAFQALLDIAVWPTDGPRDAEIDALQTTLDVLAEAIEVLRVDLPQEIASGGAAPTPELAAQMEKAEDVLVHFRDRLSNFRKWGRGESGTRQDEIAALRGYSATHLTPEVTSLLRELFLFKNSIVAGGLEQERRIIMAALGKIRSVNRTVGMVAINVSIEANRAGDAGAGFRVIADAIRDLSSEITTTVSHLSDSLDPEKDR